MNSYLIFVLAVLVIGYLLDVVPSVLNLKSISPKLPAEFEGYFDKEKYEKSQLYTKDTTKFSIISLTFSTIITISFIFIGGFEYVDKFARGFGFGTIFTGLIFTAVLLILSSLVNLPFGLYSTFVIEEKYGFNKTTLKTYFIDMLKGALVTAIIGGILLSGIFFFFETFKDMAWFYTWIAVICFTLLVQFIAPVLIMPLFNKFEPLKDGSLKTLITDYANKENFKMQGIYTMDGSKRSSKANAYFTGFGKFRRIVFFDTLMEKLEEKELLAVLAHEMGHFKLKHILKMIISSFIQMGIMFFVLSLFIEKKELFDAFGVSEVSIYGSLIFFSFIFSPFNMIVSIFGNIISRKNEYEADDYSIKSTKMAEEMIVALKKLSVANLSDLTPHPLYVFLNYSHPTVLQRIEKIRNIKL